MTDEDRKRANRISVLHWRLDFLERLLGAVTEHRKILRISLSLPHGATFAGVRDVELGGVEAERLLSGMIDDTKGELQALL